MPASSPSGVVSWGGARRARKPLSGAVVRKFALANFPVPREPQALGRPGGQPGRPSGGWSAWRPAQTARIRGGGAGPGAGGPRQRKDGRAWLAGGPGTEPPLPLPSRPAPARAERVWSTSTPRPKLAGPVPRPPGEGGRLRPGWHRGARRPLHRSVDARTGTAMLVHRRDRRPPDRRLRGRPVQGTGERFRMRRRGQEERRLRWEVTRSAWVGEGRTLPACRPDGSAGLRPDPSWSCGVRLPLRHRRDRSPEAPCSARCRPAPPAGLGWAAGGGPAQGGGRTVPAFGLPFTAPWYRIAGLRESRPAA